jgi:hypothetical protein
MDMVEDESPQADAQGQTFTPADRIAELNEIDKVLITTACSYYICLHSSSP